MKVSLFTASNCEFFPYLEGMIETLINQLQKNIEGISSYQIRASTEW